MNEFERGFQEELEKIAFDLGSLGDIATKATRGREALIGTGLGALAGGVGGYYAQKRLTGEGGLTGALGGAALGGIGGGLAGRHIGQQRRGAAMGEMGKQMARAQGLGTQMQSQALADSREHAQRMAIGKSLGQAASGVAGAEAGAVRGAMMAPAKASLALPAQHPESVAFRTMMEGGQPRSMMPMGGAAPPTREAMGPLAGGPLVSPELQPQTFSPEQAAALGMMGPVSEVAGEPMSVMGLTPAQKAFRAQNAAGGQDLLRWAQAAQSPGGAGITPAPGLMASR